MTSYYELELVCRDGATKEDVEEAISCAGGILSLSALGPHHGDRAGARVKDGQVRAEIRFLGSVKENR